MEDSKAQRAEKLLAKAIELHAQTYECIQEARKLLNGDSTIGDELKSAEKLFSSEWQRRYGSTYLFQYQKDRPQWKRLLKASGLAAVQARVLAYFHDEDQYLARARHPFGLFVSRFNTYATESAGELHLTVPTIPGCKHIPPCESDQQHTRRTIEDRRAGH